MADIEGEVQIRFGRRLSFFCCVHGFHLLVFTRLIGIKTKLDNANWFPIRQADTPLKKAFLKQARLDTLWPGLFLANSPPPPA
jgi:hypothetical protein